MKRLIFMLLLAFPILAASQIINIPDDYNTIQEGIDAASNGDTVLVQAGTYPEHLIIHDKTITLASLFLTTGDTSYIASTIIDGQDTGRVLALQLIGEEGHICGFTIMNGYVEAEWGGGIDMIEASPLISDVVIMNCSAVRGGGISTVASSASFRNVWLKSNEATDRGGGIWIQNSNAYMEDCKLSDNISLLGAGMYYYINSVNPMYYDLNVQSSVISNNTVSTQTAGLYVRHEGSNSEINISLLDCDFMDNTAAANGALQIRGDSVNFYLENCQFINNTVIDYNAGVSLIGGCQGEIVNCLFASNVANTSGADWSGGGLTSWGFGTEVFLYNCSFVENEAAYGDGITVGPGSAAYITNSIFWDSGNHPLAVVDYDNNGGEMYVEYCDVQHGQDSVVVQPFSSLNWGDHNMDADPLFILTGDDPYSLSEGSACVDAGTPDTTGMVFPPYDIIGNVRFWDGSGGGTAIIDMGAYEYGAPVWVGLDDPEDMIIQSPISIDIYPNPCRDMLNINIEAADAQKISAVLYSISGHVISNLFEKEIPEGTTEASINLSDIPAGIYFLNIRFENYSETRKIVVL